MIAIDESGDTGHKGSRFFVMVAIISRRSRHFLGAYKAIPKGASEIKFYDSKHEERLMVLMEIADADATIVYICIDKENSNELSDRGNALYLITLEELLRSAMKISPSKDLRIVIDDSRFVKNDYLNRLTGNLSKELNRNIKSCKKASSDKCVRIADYVAGSVWAKYEHGNDEYLEIIKERISVARESLRPR